MKTYKVTEVKTGKCVFKTNNKQEAIDYIGLMHQHNRVLYVVYRIRLSYTVVYRGE